MDAVTLERRNPVDKDRTSTDEVSRLRSREPEEPGQCRVDPLTFQTFWDSKTPMFWHLVRLARRAWARPIETDPAERQPHHQDGRAEDRAVSDVEDRPVRDRDPVNDRTSKGRRAAEQPVT